MAHDPELGQPCGLCDDYLRPTDPLEVWEGRLFHRGCLDDFFLALDPADRAEALAYEAHREGA